MATTKKRLNITLSPDLERAISKIAKRDQVPQATKIAELVTRALVLEEDFVWDMLAKERDIKGTKFIPHTKAWK